MSTVWSLQDCTLIYGGTRITGFGETDAIEVMREDEFWENVKCCDGGVVRNRKLCRLGSVTITLRYDSTAHAILAAKANASLSAGMTIQFPNGRVIESGDTVVQKEPTVKVGAKTSDEVWVLSCNPLEITWEQGAATV